MTPDAAQPLPETPVTKLPGEDAPLVPRPGGQPITADEALGSWRRRVRANNLAFGRNDPVPDALPLPQESGPSPMASFRLPRRKLVMAQGKLELEGDRTLSDVLNEVIDAYIAAPPGAVPVYSMPRVATRSRRG